MSVSRRIFVSMPADRWLEPSENALKWGVVERIEGLGFVPEIFTDPTGRTSLAGGLSWSATAADHVAKSCQGMAIIGFPRWEFAAQDRHVFLPTEYSHYEGALARTIGLPLLVLAQQRLQRRVVFDWSFGGYVSEFPDTADISWLDSPEFNVAFTYWRQQLDDRRDVFLGYCSDATAVATRLRDFLENDLGATVLDWARDFDPGRSILQEIEEARSRCSLGVFLFTKDDEASDPGPGREATPRDNVVFEAGYFASSKGKDRVLIVRERGAKMPADLGGDIYGSFEDRDDLTQVEESLRRFIATL